MLPWRGRIILLRNLRGSHRLSDAATSRLLTRLHALFSSIAPGTLFSDWSPPAMIPEVPVVLKASDVVADSERSSSHSGALLAPAVTSPRWFYLQHGHDRTSRRAWRTREAEHAHGAGRGARVAAIFSKCGVNVSLV